MALRYRGRFAPSPTGPLHAGSLVAALGSYLAARQHSRDGGEWLVRMEDLDTPRTVPGADAEILRCLDACGLEWDGDVVYQSSRFEAYRAALDQLTRDGHTYACACSRKEAGDGVYAGTCRGGIAPGRRAERSIRFRLPASPCIIQFVDALRGPQHEDVAATTGDFVLLRADGIWAYQLAVVVDDAWQGITHIVRGADLLDSTARQIALQRALGIAPEPAYLHLPVVTGPDGQKLSKQTRAPAVDYSRPGPALVQALTFLGQPTPAGMDRWTTREILAYAAAHLTLGGETSPP